MLLFRGKCGELTQLRDAVHEVGHLVSESFAELGCGDAGVLWDVVQECCGKRGRIKTEIGKDQRSLRRVCHIRLSRGAHLISVRLHGEIKRGSNQCCGACIFMVCGYLREERFAQLSDWSSERANLCDRVGNLRRPSAFATDRLRFCAHVC